MRLLLALMAVLALLVSPALAGTKVGCQMVARQGGDGGGMSVSMTAMASLRCDPASQHKSTQKGCPQMCAAPAAMAITVAPMPMAVPSVFTSLVMTAPNSPAVRTFEPLGLKRPPKQVA